jgi:hypothetical protein
MLGDVRKKDGLYCVVVEWDGVLERGPADIVYIGFYLGMEGGIGI